MKSLLFLLPFLFISLPSKAEYYYPNQQCNYVRRVYDESGYLIASQNYYGPCNYNNNNYSNRAYNCQPTQTVLGALLGGGIAASMSRGRGYAWSVPIGAAVGGAVIGCRRNY